MLLSPLLHESDERGQARRSLSLPRVVQERTRETRTPIITWTARRGGRMPETSGRCGRSERASRQWNLPLARRRTTHLHAAVPRLATECDETLSARHGCPRCRRDDRSRCRVCCVAFRAGIQERFDPGVDPMCIGDRCHVAGVEAADAAIGKRPSQECVDTLDDCGTAVAGEQQRGRDDCAKILRTQRPAQRCLEVQRQLVNSMASSSATTSRNRAPAAVAGRS